MDRPKDLDCYNEFSAVFDDGKIELSVYESSIFLDVEAAKDVVATLIPMINYMEYLGNNGQD